MAEFATKTDLGYSWEYRLRTRALQVRTDEADALPGKTNVVASFRTDYSVTNVTQGKNAALSRAPKATVFFRAPDGVTCDVQFSSGCGFQVAAGWAPEGLIYPSGHEFTPKELGIQDQLHSTQDGTIMVKFAVDSDKAAGIVAAFKDPTRWAVFLQAPSGDSGYSSQRTCVAASDQFPDCQGAMPVVTSHS